MADVGLRKRLWIAEKNELPGASRLRNEKLEAPRAPN